MKNFTYYQPTTVQAAVGLLDDKWGKAELLAGGTDLLDRQKDYVSAPEKVISLTAIKELSGVKAGNTGVVIGAATKLAEIADNADLKKLFPALTDAARQIAGPQIRNMGTLGGSLCQRNRCWYFRDEHVKCLLKGGEKCFALPADAENRYHAIFTQGLKCVAVHPSTLATVLIALGAQAEVVGPKGKRTLTLAAMFKAPSGPDEREHVLAPNEIVQSVTIGQSNLRNGSYEVREKLSSDWPLVQAAAAFQLDGNSAKDVRIVLGLVAPTPLYSEAAAKALEGKEVNEDTAAAAGKAAVAAAKPLGQNGYKVRLTEVAVKRAILAAAGKRYWEA